MEGIGPKNPISVSQLEQPKKLGHPTGQPNFQHSVSPQDALLVSLRSLTLAPDTLRSDPEASRPLVSLQAKTALDITGVAGTNDLLNPAAQTKLPSLDKFAQTWVGQSPYVTNSSFVGSQQRHDTWLPTQTGWPLEHPFRTERNRQLPLSLDSTGRRLEPLPQLRVESPLAERAAGRSQAEAAASRAVASGQQDVLNNARQAALGDMKSMLLFGGDAKRTLEKSSNRLKFAQAQPKYWRTIRPLRVTITIF